MMVLLDWTATTRTGRRKRSVVTSEIFEGRRGGGAREGGMEGASKEMKAGRDDEK